VALKQVHPSVEVVVLEAARFAAADFLGGRTSGNRVALATSKPHLDLTVV
jgi:hypothetical protein